MLLVPTVWTETEITKEYLTHLSCSPLTLKAGWADKSSQSNLPCVQSGHPEIRRRHVMRNQKNTLKIVVSRMYQQLANH